MSITVSPALTLSSRTAGVMEFTSGTLTRVEPLTLAVGLAAVAMTNLSCICNDTPDPRFVSRCDCGSPRAPSWSTFIQSDHSVVPVRRVRYS